MDAAPSPVAITDDSFLSPTGALLSADKERVSDAYFSSCREKWATGGTVPMKNTAIGRKASRRRR